MKITKKHEETNFVPNMQIVGTVGTVGTRNT